MSEHLIHINWATVTSTKEAEAFNSSYWQEFDEIYPDKSLLIGLSGVDSFASALLSDSGDDIFDKKAYEAIIDYIKNEIDPKPIDVVDGKVDLWAAIRDAKREKPTTGELIVVIDVNSWQSNHPQDPEEWDMSIDFLGILGREVKLTYEGKKL